MASRWTTNCNDPAGVPGAAVAVATPVSDDVAWRAFQPLGGARAEASVWSAIRSLLICWYSGHVGIERGLLVLQVGLGLLVGLELGLDDLLGVEPRLQAVVDDGRSGDRAGQSPSWARVSSRPRSGAGSTAD